MQTLRQWLSTGDYTLALSSSFFGFYAHCGAATALYDLGFQPKKLTGSSAGALVGGALASGLQPTDIRDILFSVKRQDFWDPGIGFGVLRGEKFRQIVRRHFVTDIAETVIPFAVGVFDLLSWRTRYLASGPMPEAISASCAVPVMFHPVRIGRKIYLDGGILDKSGINHDDESRTLGIFISHDPGPKNPARKLAADHRVLRVKGLPRPHPLRLDIGRDAFEQARQRVLQAMEQPFATPAIDI